MNLPERVTFTVGGKPVPYRASVTPLTATEMFDVGRDIASVTYRVTLPARVHEIEATAVMQWRGKTYSALGPALRFTISGRVSHWELIVGRTTG